MTCPCMPGMVTWTGPNTKACNKLASDIMFITLENRHKNAKSNESKEIQFISVQSLKLQFWFRDIISQN